MKLVPDTLTPPTTAITPATPLKIKSNGWQSGTGAHQEPGEYPVLAIGWHGASTTPHEFVYLVFDRLQNEVVWISESLVDSVNGG